MAKIEKSPLSEPSSMNTKEQVGVSNGIKKPSVRKELAMLKIEARKINKLKNKERAPLIKSLKGKDSIERR